MTTPQPQDAPEPTGDRSRDAEQLAALQRPGVAGPPGSMGAERLLDGYAGCRAFDEWRGY